MLSCGHSYGFISEQTGDSEKTLRAYYAKYLEETDIRRDLVQASVRGSVERVRNQLNKHLSEIFRGQSKMKKPLENQRLQDGAGEEGRTPDLMLGNYSSTKQRS